MIQVTPHMRVLVAVEPADFRKGIDGLAAVCRAVLQQDPFSGTVFVFGNRRRQAIKILVYDGQGFWLCQKKLESEDTQIVDFTETGRSADNHPIGPAEAGRVVGMPRKSRSRRCIMSGQGSPRVPPRALRQGESFHSINSGRS